MFQVKFNEQHLVVFNTASGIGLCLGILLTQSLPSYAGAQSLLDPYADVLPVNSKSETRSIKQKVLKQQPVRQKESSLEQASVNNIDTAEVNNRSVSPVADDSSKTKVHKAEKNKISHSDSSGFLSGIKEMQHGSVTSLKAAGGGIVNGSKVAGAKLADGTKDIGSGLAAASSKVISGSKNLVAKNKTQKSKPVQTEVSDASQKANTGHKGLISKIPALKFSKLKKSQTKVAKAKTNSGHKGLIAKLPTFKFPKFKKASPQVASVIPPAMPTAPTNSTLAAKPIFPALPGKPLDQVLAQEKQRKRLKDITFTGNVEQQPRRPGIITNAVSKVGFLHKTKKTSGPNIAASNLTANNLTQAPQ